MDGHISKFNMGNNSGVVTALSGKEYNFSAASFIGKIPNLHDYPGVNFDIKNDVAINIAYNENLERPVRPPRSGFAILGAAKCPNCAWRLPMIPDAGRPKARNGETFDCPQCDSPLKLISAFIGFHHYAAVGILVVPFILRRILVRSGHFFSSDTFSILNTASLLFIPIQIILFLFLYFQEKLIINQAAEIFR